jgi:hypothetical protein
MFDGIPNDDSECTHGDETFLQITVDYVNDSDNEGVTMGGVNLHMHNMNPLVLIDTLFSICMQVGTSIFNDNPVFAEGVPESLKQTLSGPMVKAFLVDRLKNQRGTMSEVVTIPDDLSELLGDN